MGFGEHCPARTGRKEQFTVNGRELRARPSEGFLHTFIRRKRWHRDFCWGGVKPPLCGAEAEERLPDSRTSKNACSTNQSMMHRRVCCGSSSRRLGWMREENWNL